jgi:lipopolysaccharide export system protein LptA
MPISIIRLRYWFAVAAIVLATMVAIFYVYAQWRVRHAVREVPGKLGVQIQQSTEGFTLSKSEGGRTLFTVRASNAVQFKAGGRALLHDVSIVIYGRQANRFDQIYGKEFEYDPRSGEIIGKGAVHIDLEGNAEGPVRPDQTPPEELKNPVHVETTNLSFNQKTGNGVTAAPVRFSMPQAIGSAMGASYDSKQNMLTMQSDVNLTTTGTEVTNIRAEHGVITKHPRQVVLDAAHLVRADKAVAADQATIFLKPDNTAERVLGIGHVEGESHGEMQTRVRSAQGDFLLSPHNLLRSGILSGGVLVDASGKEPAHAAAQRAFLEFGPKNELLKVRAVEKVRMVQNRAPSPDGQAQRTELNADRVDFLLKPGGILQRADTSGAAQIVVLTANSGNESLGNGRKSGTAQPSGPTHTLVTARKFRATFNENNRLRTIHGASDAKIVSTTPGQPERVSTSRTLDVAFAPAGDISQAVQKGDVHFTDAQRQAWADKANYAPTDGTLLLTGSPRVVDGGTTTTANTIRMLRRTGEAFAQDHVKTTYSDLKPDSSGALLASSDPIHVIANSMTGNQNSGLAVYSGAARLWQGSNIVEAPTITFNKTDMTVLAQGTANHKATTILVQTNAAGGVSPVNVTCDRLTYLDRVREVRCEGNAVMKSADGTVTSDRATAYLVPKDQQSPARDQPTTYKNGPVPSQLDHIIADGRVIIVQPTRHGNGEHLVYTAADGKFVLTGGSPSIFDAERGTTRGDSLTFYNRDDRVLVDSTSSTPAITQTRVAK